MAQDIIYMKLEDYPRVRLVICVKKRLVIINQAAGEDANVIQLDFSD